MAIQQPRPDTAQILPFPAIPSLPNALKALERHNRKKRPRTMDGRLILLLLEHTVSRLIASKALDPTVVILLCMAREHLTAALKISEVPKTGE
ncbi:hypothetical protein [Methylomagnum ishizawai]|uniref:hypothetical protein n=1 Tax=Methylomagnum ishizawai TaxID=1760988 RepID=UPI001C325B84|nr:hypothetical protein [Methylomagnum ishizawai]BBL75456.1 hypothetical protein MishRS11D_25540 [Methylomagnum ishizawai]